MSALAATQKADLFATKLSGDAVELALTLRDNNPSQMILHQRLFTCWRPGPGRGWSDRRVTNALTELDEAGHIEWVPGVTGPRVKVINLPDNAYKGTWRH